MKRTPLAIILALALLLVPVGNALADSSADITVTATPLYLSLVLDVNTWTINGITGDGIIDNDTTYYSNPLGDTTAPSATVVDGECRFQFTNSSSVAIDITINFPDFTGGDAMENIDTGYANNDTNSFGVSGYESGDTWPDDAVIFKSAASDVFISNLAKDGTKKWGMALKTKSGAFSSRDEMSSTVTATATEH